MIIDKEVSQQILGSLIKCPQLLNEVDKYNLTLSDFPTRFEKYIFSAIHGLYFGGAENIQIIDIENYLKSNPTAKATFDANQGIEYLQDIEEFSKVENFPYYYDKLKKINLLNDLKKDGFDISDYYSEDLLSDKALEVNSHFEEIESKDIINDFKKKIIKLESDYGSPEEVKCENAADGIDDFIETIFETEDIGLPIQGVIYNQIIDGAQPTALTIRSGGSGVGKALPNSTKIPTPEGWKRVDEIKVGDYLFDAFGKPTKVLNVYPQGKKEVWEIKFKDGRTAKCCNEHLWSYNIYSQKGKSKKERKFYTKTLKEIVESEDLKNKKGSYRILIPQQYAVEYKEQKHFIPPYLMGLFLGDGSFIQNKNNKSFQYSSEDEELPSKIAQTMGWILKRGSKNNYTWYFGFKNKQENQKDKINIWVEDILKEHLDLLNTNSYTKFIPNSYIYDSIENRYDLLSGLLDSDGSVDKKGRITYTTVSKNLKNQVIELCESLGLKANYFKTTRESKGTTYTICITGRPNEKVKLFKMKRKKEIILNWYNNSNRKVKNEYNPIIEINNLNYQEDMTCFYVDNEEHLFLTENFIVTHNTRQAVGDACMLAYPIRFNEDNWKWEQIGSSEKVLFIITEQTFKQIRKMILAYLTGFNESRFKYKDFSKREMEVIEQAKKIMKEYNDNFIILQIPNPTIELVKTQIRDKCLTKDIGYVFYDYIFIGPALLGEFRGFNLRNDKLFVVYIAFPFISGVFN